MVFRSVVSFIFTVIILLPCASGNQGHLSIADSGLLVLTKPGTLEFMVIRCGDKVAFKKGFSDSYTEVIIERISSDTLFFRNGMIHTGRILAFSLWHGNHKYDIDLSTWVFVIPPPDVYGSTPLLNVFCSWIGKHCNSDGSYDVMKWEYYHSSITAGHDTTHWNFLKFDMLRVLYLQFTAMYERKFPGNISLEVGGGYQVRLDIGSVPFTYYGENPFYPFSGPLLIAGVKFYGLSRLIRYVYMEPQVIYKYVYFKDDWYEDPSESTSIFQDQYRNVAGATINFGFQKISTGMVVDMAFGVGFKYTQIHQVCYYYKEPQSGLSYYNAEHTPVTKDEDVWYPLINLSVKLGFGF